MAINEDIKTENSDCPDCGAADFQTVKSIEVGNIFKLGTKYSVPFGLKFREQDGKEKDVIMGCYGLGPARIMGTIAEISHDDKGIIWPENVAPYKYHLLILGENEAVKKEANALYEKLAETGTEVLYDDRELSAGEKFAEADLIGLPYRLVISAKTIAQKSVEIKKRNEKETRLVEFQELAELSSERA